MTPGKDNSSWQQKKTQKEVRVKTINYVSLLSKVKPEIKINILIE